MAQQIFARQEKKYFLTPAVYEAFLREAEPYIEPDRKFPRYTISNVYYDSIHFDLIRRSIEKPMYKEKLRLRGYDVPGPDDMVYVEVKKKYDGVVYKRRVTLTLREAEAFLNDHILPQRADSQILRELSYLVEHFELVPKLYLAYDRIAFQERTNPSFRLTFDEKIRFRQDRLSLAAGDDGELLLPLDAGYLLELKVSDTIPHWLVRILAAHQLYPTSFSKYGTIYREKMFKTRSEKHV
ncbi:MAG: polyphosphate polymerase domain-containing protein [Eubacteriales bacterium]